MVYRIAQIATVLVAEQRQRGVSIPKSTRRARCAANSHIAVVGAGMLRATRRYVSMRPVEGSRDTALPGADIVENLKYFSAIPFAPTALVRVLSSLLSSCSSAPPTIKLTKGNIKLNYACSVPRVLRSGGRCDRCNGASNIRRTAISLNTQAPRASR